MLVMKIWIAYVLDLIFGDPQNIIHPVQVIGKMISSGEKFLLGENSGLSRKYKFFAGMILNITVISVTYAVTYLIYKSSERSIIFMIAEIYLMYTIFSINSLAREGNRVYNILKEGNIEKARKEGMFDSIDELKIRAKLGKSGIELLRNAGCLKGMTESNQMSLFI